MNIADLIEAIAKATVTIEVLVESTDYYRRPGDTEKSYILAIDPEKLMDNLRSLLP